MRETLNNKLKITDDAIPESITVSLTDREKRIQILQATYIITAFVYLMTNTIVYMHFPFFV